ncbi:acyltransferase ChoActase/COT/CPT [Absidia repens]|uniref:Acyltransferase ChoActase/COT/CPT n=1 Tax=Absidia repens TaxID=90262 RepID=A0A1X2IZE0_9FUNG|nr:acyltransferase ChoActase/COT/CPT [Absidia repens]
MTVATFALQNTLPRLPIPSLQKTCSLYLHSLLPFQTPEEHEKSKAIIQDFMNSSLASSLQQRLVDIDHHSPRNWLEDNYWLRKAYLEWREPLMVNSNWYILGKNDDHHPKALLENNGQGLGPNQFSHFQIRRAATMIFNGADQTLPVEMVRGKQPLCMWQYSHFLSMTRVPLPYCDALVQGNPSDVLHIVVLACDKIYKLQIFEVLDGKKQCLSIDRLERGLLEIVAHASNTNDVQKPVPLLTSWDRDNWAIARNHLLTIDPAKNRTALSEIEYALFAVCLDDYNHGADSAQWSKTAFCGQQNRGQGHNRWFDKSLSLVVENNGKAFIAGEHSPVDALTVSYMWDHMLRKSVVQASGADNRNVPWLTNAPAPSVIPSTSVEPITFVTDHKIDEYLKQAQASANAISARSDSSVLIFDEFGTDWIKRVGKLPPDAFYQMVLQLAYYRAHKKVTATYETASTRKYLCGRTETIRSCSIDSKNFVEAFDDPMTSDKNTYDLLVKATAAHRKYTQIASDGHGCDRHLLVLKLLNMDHPQHESSSSNSLKQTTTPLHAIFTDPVFSESQTWRLSTSGLQEGDQLMGTGFGAAFKHGYGINYMAARNLVKFGMEAKNDEDSLSTKEFASIITQTLRDLRDLCERVNLDGNPEAPSTARL